MSSRFTATCALITQWNRARIEPKELNTLFFSYAIRMTIDDTLVIHHIIHSCLVLRYGHDGFRMMIADNTPFGMSLDGCVMCIWIDYMEHYLESLAFRMKILFDAQSTNGKYIWNILMQSITIMSSYILLTDVWNWIN